MFDILEDTAYDSNNQQAKYLYYYIQTISSYLGFYSHILWVGELEYDLYEQGLYEDFKDEFEKISGKSWIDLVKNLRDKNQKLQRLYLK